MISEFFFQIAELKKLPRSGWKIKVGLENSESVAEHSYMMSVMSMVLSDMKSLNSEKYSKCQYYMIGLNQKLEISCLIKLDMIKNQN